MNAGLWAEKVSLLLLCFAANVAWGATPPSGTVSPAAPELSYTTGPHFDSNAGDCDSSPCDDFALTLDLPATYAATNPGAKLEVDLVYTVPGDLDLQLLNSDNSEADNSGQPAGLPEHMEVAAGQGLRTFTVRVIPFAVAGTSATVTVRITNPPATPPPPPPSGLPPRFQGHVAPPSLGNDAGEPSIGANWSSHNAMFISSTQALRLEFAENASPALPMACDANWLDKSGTITTLNTLDPILFTDQATGRTFNSQLSGANSLFEYTDDDGENWSPGQVGSPNGGADHQTIATGVYPAGFVPPLASWPAAGPKRAVYYCSQSVAAAFCARSDDGGQTFGPGVPIKDGDCSVGALHGHVKVAPDGTVYVPDASQCLAAIGSDAEKVIAFVSEDAGATWDVRPIPQSAGGAASDPSIGLATDGTAYMCYENADSHVHVAVSHDKGLNWVNDTDIGAYAGIVASRFPQSVAGDPNRAACAFLGTTESTGDPNSLDFKGVWHGYVATTYDGGVSWHVVNALPNDPVQGEGGVGPDGTNRNLLDFNDLQIDEKGRLLFAFADGCIGGCVRDPSQNSFAAKASVLRQTGGRTLFSLYDNVAGTRFNATTPIAPAPACAQQALSLRTVAQSHVVWNAPDDGGTPITSYQVQRATSENGVYASVGSTNGKTEFIDTSADPTVPEYWYQVIAQNAQGTAVASNKIVLPVSPSPPVVDTCTLPGDIIAVDTIGDGTADDTDIVYIAVAEPEAFAGNFVITEKIKNFTSGSPPASSFYPILFPSQGNLYVGLDATQAVPKFAYGTYQDVGQGVLSFTETGALDARSGFQADGTIRLVVPKSRFANTAIGAVVAGFDARARIGAQSATSRDTAGPSDYTVRGTAICSQPGIVLATLEASTLAGAPPLQVEFGVTGTPPAGKSLANYTLSFGDGTSVSNQSFMGNPRIQVMHTYNSAGTFRATLVVTDNAGDISTNNAEQTIEVGTSADFLFGDSFESP
jgi:hypothetical protein